MPKTKKEIKEIKKIIKERKEKRRETIKEWYMKHKLLKAYR